MQLLGISRSMLSVVSMAFVFYGFDANIDFISEYFNFFIKQKSSRNARRK